MPAAFKGRSKVILYKICLFFCSHDHAGVIAAVQWFILWSNRINSNALSFHGLYIFYKIAGIYIIVFGKQVSAN